MSTLEPNWVQATVAEDCPVWQTEKLFDLRLQSRALINYVAHMPPVSFLRRTGLSGETQVVSNVLRESAAGEPFLGAFTRVAIDQNSKTSADRQKEAIIAAYPGYLMTKDEHDILHKKIRCLTGIHYNVPLTRRQFFGGGNMLVIVGDPMAPGCNVMCVYGTITEAQQNSLLLRNSVKQMITNDEKPRILDAMAYFGVLPVEEGKGIKAGKEVICQLYDKEFFNGEDDEYCSWCYRYGGKTELCPEEGCGRRYHQTMECHGLRVSPSEPWRCIHHDSSDRYPKLPEVRIKQIMLDQAQETLQDIQDYASSASAASAASGSRSRSQKRSRKEADNEEEEEEPVAAAAAAAPRKKAGRKPKPTPVEDPIPQGPADEDRTRWEKIGKRLSMFLKSQEDLFQDLDVTPHNDNPESWLRVTFRLAGSNGAPLNSGRFREWVEYYYDIKIHEMIYLNNDRWTVVARFRNHSRHAPNLSSAAWKHESMKRFVHKLPSKVKPRTRGLKSEARKKEVLAEAEAADTDSSDEGV